MELTNDFRVSVAPDRAWEVLTDVERIAPLLPGAQLQEIEGDEYRGIVKVKVGPIQAQYKGVASFLERDRDSGKVVLKASGRDTRGQGNANATITATMSADGDGTKVSVVTDLTITGKVAQFGRGVLADVSGKLITQFVDALEADLDAPAAPGGDPAAAAPAPPAGGVPAPASASDVAAGEPLVGQPAPPPASSSVDGLAGVVADGPVGPGTTAATPGAPTPPSGGPTQGGVRRIHAPEPEPVDLLDAAGGSVAKRIVPLAGAAGLVLVIVLLRRRARARRRGLAALRSQLPSVGDIRDHLPSVGDVRDHLPSVGDVRDHLPDAAALQGAARCGGRAARRSAKAARRAGTAAAARAHVR